MFEKVVKFNGIKGSCVCVHDGRLTGMTEFRCMEFTTTSETDCPERIGQKNKQETQSRTQGKVGNGSDF